MCGICGIAAAEPGQKIDPDTLRRMADVIEYRGPDDADIYVSGPVGLANAAPEHHRPRAGWGADAQKV